MRITATRTRDRDLSAAPRGTAGRALRALALAALGTLASGAASAQVGAARGELDPELAALYEDTAINPFDAVGANNLAVKLAARGDYEKARKLLRRAARLDPARPEIARNADQVQRLLDQREQLSERARSHFRDSFAAVDVPSVADVWVPNGPRSFGPRADAAAEVADAETSDERLAANPFDTRWLLERAAIKTRRGEHRAALADLRRAQALDPYLSGIESRIERLERSLPELAEPASSQPSAVPVRPLDDELDVPAPWGVEERPAREKEA